MTATTLLRPGVISILSSTEKGFETTTARIEKDVCELVLAVDGIGSVYIDQHGRVFCRSPIITAIFLDDVGSFTKNELMYALADLGPTDLGLNTVAFTAFPGKIVLVQNRISFLNINIVNEVIIKARLQEYTEGKNR